MWHRYLHATADNCLASCFHSAVDFLACSGSKKVAEPIVQIALAILCQRVFIPCQICHYLDLPIQHGSDAVLKRMGRRTTQAELRSIIGRLREEIPDIALRTTLIAGFPGETEADHQEVLQFVKDMRFDRLGVFTYSEEEGTAAAQMPDQIDEAVKETRRDALMMAQQAIAFDKSEEMVGKTVDVLIEGRLPEEDVYIGRTYRDAPDVDGYVFVHAEEDMISGDIVKVKITDAQDYDLVGDVIYEFTE